MTANTSDGKPLEGFHRKQYGATIGGPFKKDKAFYFFAFEGIRENLERANLSEQIGATPCPIATPTILANEAAINGNDDCQRLALINFFRTTRNQEEGLPVSHKINNQAFFSRVDFDFNSANHLSVSYNFDYSKNTNQTFDVPTYGNSANGIEGPSKINVIRANLFTTVSPTKLNEAHFSYSRELRPRSAVDSNVPADTAMGFATTFRFGVPFFLEPNVDELLWRTHVKDNFSIITGDHNIKFGGEWLHTLNDQVFRGFFTGRYIFDSVTGFLRYASAPAANGFGPNAGECFNACRRLYRMDHAGRSVQSNVPALEVVSVVHCFFICRTASRLDRRCSAARRIEHQERRHRFVRSGQVADSTQLHFELRPALGSSDFPGAGGTTQSNRLCFVADRIRTSRLTARCTVPRNSFSRASALHGIYPSRANQCCALTPVFTTGGRTCCRRSVRSQTTACSSLVSRADHLSAAATVRACRCGPTS